MANRASNFTDGVQILAGELPSLDMRDMSAAEITRCQTPGLVTLQPSPSKHRLPKRCVSPQPGCIIPAPLPEDYIRRMNLDIKVVRAKRPGWQSTPSQVRRA
jgi:hypothetical protein